MNNDKNKRIESDMSMQERLAQIPFQIKRMVQLIGCIEAKDVAYSIDAEHKIFELRFSVSKSVRRYHFKVYYFQDQNTYAIVVYRNKATMGRQSVRETQGFRQHVPADSLAASIQELLGSLR